VAHHDRPATGGPRDAEDAWSAADVQRLRAHLGLSQAELAARVGTRQQTISEWETGTRAPRRMSRRLLRLVAEEAGAYDLAADAAPPHAPDAGAADTPR
jgi:DNA-binding transcriptional regulator YiaG